MLNFVPENYIKIPKIISLLIYTQGKGLVANEGEAWKRSRKIISSSFRFELLKGMISDIVKISDDFLEALKQGNLNSVDLVEECQSIAVFRRKV